MHDRDKHHRDDRRRGFERDRNHPHDARRDDQDRDRYTGTHRERAERDYPQRGYGFRQAEYGDLDRDGNYVGERSHRWNPNAGWDDRFRPAVAHVTDGPFYGFDEGTGRFAGQGPRGYQRSDERIREDVCDALMRDSMIDASDIEVCVEAGHVTLGGTIDARRIKRRVEDVCEAVLGVQDVTNQLKIKPRES